MKEREINENKKIFGEINLTWGKLIVFSVLAGIYTALMALIPILKDTSFRDIVVTFEVWILFGIIIIMNSKSAIDSAQFRNLRTEKEIKLLKGKIIIIRTSTEECYKRVVNRWKEISKNYNEEELTRYQNRKLGMFEWYKSLNDFITKIDSL